MEPGQRSPRSPRSPLRRFRNSRTIRGRTDASQFPPTHDHANHKESDHEYVDALFNEFEGTDGAGAVLVADQDVRRTNVPFGRLSVIETDDRSRWADDSDVEDEDEDANDDNFELAKNDNSITMADRLVDTRTLPSLPDLYGLNRTILGHAVSSEKGSKCIFAWHVLFCTINNRIPYVDPESAEPNQKFGLSLYRQNAFTATTTDSSAYDTKFLGEMFEFLQNYATTNLMKKAITFYNAHLRAEHRIRMQAAGNPSVTNGDAKVGQNSDVKRYLSSAIGRRASQAMERCDDLHAGVDDYITEHEIHTMLDLVFSPKPVGKVSRMDAINRINFAASFCASQQDVRRGDEHYGQWIVQRFIRPLRKIGASMGGTIISMVMTRQAKHNQYGRIELMGYCPHVDPIRDSSSWHGLMWLYRIHSMREQLVFFTDDGSFDYESNYRVPTYRAASQGRGKRKKDPRIGKVTYRNNWASFFSEGGVFVAKLTSHWRLQAFHEMDDSGLSDSQMARMSGHRAKGKDQTAAQAQNYQTNLSVHGLVQRAGCRNPRQPETHNVPRQSATTVVSQFVRLLCGDNLCQWQDRMHLLHAQCQSHFQRRELRLITGKHFVDALVHDVENAVRFLASRPRDPISHKILPGEDQCFFDKYRNSTTFFELFNLPAFSSPLWEEVKLAVRRAEDCAQSMNIDSLLSQPVHNEMQRNTNAIASLVAAQGQHIMNGVTVAMQGFQAQMLALMHAQQSPTCVPPRGSSPSRINVRAPNPRLSSNHSGRSTVQSGRSAVPVVKRPVVNNKRLAVPMEQARAAEAPREDGVPRVIWKGRDRGFKCFDDWWRFYLKDLKPMEDEHGVLCRRDEYIQVADPATGEISWELPRHNKNWFSARHVIWDVPRYRIFVQEEDEEIVLQHCRQLYDACRPKKGGRPNLDRKAPIEALHKKFMAEWDALNQKSKGRPQGSGGNPKRRKICNNSGGATIDDVLPQMTAQELEDSLNQTSQQMTDEERVEYLKNKAEGEKVAEARRMLDEQRRMTDAQKDQSLQHGGWFLDRTTGLSGYIDPPRQQYFEVPRRQYAGPDRRLAPSLHGTSVSAASQQCLAPKQSVVTPAASLVPRTYQPSAYAHSLMRATEEQMRTRPPTNPSPPPPPSPPERVGVCYERNIPNPNLPRHVLRQLEVMAQQSREQTARPSESGVATLMRARNESDHQRRQTQLNPSTYNQPVHHTMVTAAPAPLTQDDLLGTDMILQEMDNIN